MRIMKQWLINPIAEYQFWAEIAMIIGVFWTGMIGMFLLLIYSEVNWEVAKQKIVVVIIMLFIGLGLYASSYIGRKVLHK